MPFDVERLNDPIPRNFAVEKINYRLRVDVPRFAMVHRLNCLSQLVDALAHCSIISTRSRTVQNVFVTPAAIAGVHRIAMLDFTKL